jgi:hypothetical protein
MVQRVPFHLERLRVHALSSHVNTGKRMQIARQRRKNVIEAMMTVMVMA